VKATALAILWTCIRLSALPDPLCAKPLHLQELAGEPQVDRVADVDGADVEPSKVLGDSV
jgi:hypothetical protein